MSWPSDGKPRYIAAVVSGYRRPTVGNSRVPKHCTAAVLDRAICHREVAAYVSEDHRGGSGYGNTTAGAVENALRLANEHCDRLNAEEVAA